MARDSGTGSCAIKAQPPVSAAGAAGLENAFCLSLLEARNSEVFWQIVERASKA